MAGWISDLCRRLGIPCLIANPNNEAWRWRNVKRKTDRDDALKLARLAAGDELPVVPQLAPAVRQKRSLLKCRQEVISQRVAVQNHLRALAEAQGRRLAPGHKAWTQAGLAVLDGWAKPLEECDMEELWRGQLHQMLTLHRQLIEHQSVLDDKLAALAQCDAAVIRLRTIPGVGRCIAEVVANYLPDPARFRRASEVSAYAGLVPRQYQSGEQDRRGRIHKRGPGLLRKMLVEGAWGLLRFNRWAATVFHRLTRGNSWRRKKAIRGGRPQTAGAVLGDAASSPGLDRTDSRCRVRMATTRRALTDTVDPSGRGFVSEGCPRQLEVNSAAECRQRRS
jgi:transposase